MSVFLASMFFVYLIVGGMPDAVKTYIDTKDIREVDKIQKDIVTLYKESFTQYELDDKKLKFDLLSQRKNQASLSIRKETPDFFICTAI